MKPSKSVMGNLLPAPGGFRMEVRHSCSREPAAEGAMISLPQQLIFSNTIITQFKR